MSDNAITPEAEAKKSALNRHLDAIFNLDHFVQVCISGFNFAGLATEVVDVVHRLNNKSTPPTAEQLKEAEKLESFSRAQAKQGFPMLFALGTVQTWSILEALADDLLEEELAVPAVRASCEPLKKIKGNLLEFADASDEDRVRILAERLKETVAAPLKPGIGRFEEVFCLIGIGGAVPASVRKGILELSEVRHVIIHRAGQADVQFLARCPWFELTGGEVRVQHAHFALYAACARWYFLELSRRMNLKKGVETSERQLTIQDTQLSTIESMWLSRSAARRSSEGGAAS